VFLVIALSLVPHGLQYGAEGALITESFSPNVRYSGSAVGYQLASILGGGPTPIIAALLFARDPSGYLIAGYLLVCSVISIIAAAFMREQMRSTADQPSPSAVDRTMPGQEGRIPSA
jgi:hypothetical protein